MEEVVADWYLVAVSVGLFVVGLISLRYLPPRRP
jgi:hypothetical protein